MAEHRVSISISSPSSTDSRDDGHVTLRVEDDASGECLVHVEIPAGRWWRLCQGSTQHHLAGVSPHLDRLGKRLETTVVAISDPVEGDTAKDTRRDIFRAIQEDQELLDAGWLDYAGEARIRRTNNGHEAILRRWVEPADG